MKKVWKIVLVALSVLLLAMSGTAFAAQTVTVEGKNGPVEVPVNPARIVVMDYGMLDTIDALQKAGAIKHEIVLALPESNLPEYLSQFRGNKSITDVGGLKNFNLETIYAFKPDLIIISGRQQDFYNDLSAMAPVWQIDSLPADYLPGVEKNIRAMGKIFNAEQEVEKQLAAIDCASQDVRKIAEAKKLKALILLTNDGKISVYGSGSRFGIIHETLGIGQADEHIQPGIHGQLVNYEYIADKNPDALFVIDRSIAVGGKADGVRLLRNDLVDATTAAKEKRIISLDPSVWYLSGGGLESLRRMVTEVHDALAR